MGAPATAVTEMWLVCSLQGGVYVRAKEHARSQRNVSSYQFAYSDEEVVNSNPNNNGSKCIVRS